jgi:copper(I)-binding protein
MIGGFLALFVTMASADPLHQYKLGAIEIDNPWSRATVSAATNGVAYLTITNRDTTSDRLVEVASPIAGQAELHQMQMENDMAKMWPLDSVEIPAGGTVALAPHGAHIMLMGLKAPLELAQTFPLTLTFEKAGSITVEVTVESMAATEPSH